MSALVRTLAMQIRLVGMPEPEFEYKFALPARKWRFDMCWPKEMVAVECDGGIWSGGRHVRGQGFENDLRKLSMAAIAGWKVIRVTSGMIESGEALKLIELAGICGRKTA